MTTAEYKNKQRKCKRYKSQLINRATKSELKMIERLNKMGLHFIFQKGFIKHRGFYICDFYLPKRKLVIEIDGQTHFTKTGMRKDEYKNDYLTEERGFSVLRITNQEVFSISDSRLYKLICESMRRYVSYSDGYFISVNKP